ncbi:hypothetical protein O3P69_011120 [Scylla paramamosain]|uniref:Transposase n=1 Tax=Scylla paramamosain TaxID=85552 RepID=A0AAW0SUP1_SCYPA
MKELVPACPPCLVFMDLAWPGSARRRILIHLTHDTPRGQQFLLLCTGQQGPSYANTRLFKLLCRPFPPCARVVTHITVVDNAHQHMSGALHTTHDALPRRPSRLREGRPPPRTS